MQGSRAAKNLIYKKRGIHAKMRKGYSAKAGAAGKDLGKPGKAFSKIATSAGKKYGSKAAGARVAGAILKKLRARHA
jgi:hypothetical protein